MRRSERAITDDKRIDAFIRSCDTIRLGFVGVVGVSIIPMSFGFENKGGQRVFYLHSARHGGKMDSFLISPQVSFELDKTYEIREGQQACAFTALYQSIMGRGRLHLLEEETEKAKALNHLMAQYTKRSDWSFPTAVLEKTAVFALRVSELSCKSNLPALP